MYRQQAHYFATKHAVVGWTRSISSMLKEICNVRVNAVCPSWVGMYTSLPFRLNDAIFNDTET